LLKVGFFLFDLTIFKKYNYEIDLILIIFKKYNYEIDEISAYLTD